LAAKAPNKLRSIATLRVRPEVAPAEGAGIEFWAAAFS
jgi:hypothetical protein